ncbi:hypothetical protein HOF92_11230 [bacterium]|jgi:hypothetical protein|nr:hypothetical protein [bacterium]
MEEVFLIFLACLILGSSFYLYYYPLYTICALVATVGISWRWWSKKRRQLEFQEQENSRLERVGRYPRLSSVYLPHFESTIQDEIKVLKKDLESHEHGEILDVLTSLEQVFREKILPRKRALEENLDRYTTTNQLVLQDELKHQKGLLQEADGFDRPSIEQSIQSLEQKRLALKETEDELVQFYSQTRIILKQMEELRTKLAGPSDPGQLLTSLTDANNLLDELSEL